MAVMTNVIIPKKTNIYGTAMKGVNMDRVNESAGIEQAHNEPKTLLTLAK